MKKKITMLIDSINLWLDGVMQQAWKKYKNKWLTKRGQTMITPLL
jgi:hypothetical protein